MSDDPYSSAPKPNGNGKSGVVRALIWVILLAIFGYAFYYVLTTKEDPKAHPPGRRGVSGPVNLTTTTAEKGDIGLYFDAIGTVTPVYTASVVSQVTGVVSSVAYQEGQLVKKGDPLVEIDARQYEATLLQAQGTLERDESVLGQAQMDLERYRAAWARNAVSKQILEDQEKAVHQNQGAVKNDQGAVQFDQIQVDYCHIASPIAGRVGLRLVDPGNLVTAGALSSPLVVVTQMQPITVIFTIPEDNLGVVQAQLRKDAKLPVDVFDRSAQMKLASGELLALDNQIDTTTGTVKVRASFPNDDFALFPNQFVNTRLLVQKLEGVTLVVSSAIQQNGPTSFVYVVKDDVVHQQTVKVGVSDKGFSQVEGIEPGDVLANSSFEKLQDGDPVSVAGSRPPGAPHPHGGGGAKGP